MKKYIYSLFLLFTTATFAQNQISPVHKTVEIDTEYKGGIECALTFINGYVEVCNNMGDDDQWVYSNQHVTENLKKQLKKLIDDAYKEDPEYGLGFDPILDAQDYPDDGFKFDSLDKKNGYVFVRGVIEDWADFKIAIKIVKQKDKWLVDGCGVVNIPEEVSGKLRGG